jgi:Domain of unknown function (DUF4169)
MSEGGKVLSLSKARKGRARAAKRAGADANAVKFGRSWAERERQEAEDLAARRRLDGLRIDRFSIDGPKTDEGEG